MQRQSSIRSFLEKPGSYSQMLHQRRAAPFPPNEHKHAVPFVAAEKERSLEVSGTDTPPEKPKGKVFEESSPTDMHPRSVSYIMQKLRKTRELESSQSTDYGSSRLCDIHENKRYDKDLQKHLKYASDFSALNFNLCSEQEPPASFDCHSNTVFEPETPASKPLVPRVKRIQDNSCRSVDVEDPLILKSSKRIKLLHDPAETNIGEKYGMTARKFDWLNPQSIRDAERRRPDDPLYDKRTLYIPPNTLKNMSASQKQYWSIKSQYMDVILFFKVGTFYELYELDAEIGHHEFDWKMTYSGVGKCRQVGISESGIDDAIQKLVARGYKVGRVEQTETSGHAKARGSTSVIQRKLVHVFTPATLSDGNLSSDAIHLLALKEGDNGSNCLYGFAFVDCAALKFWVGTICDDTSRTGLGALLMQISPKEILYENKGLSTESQKAIKKYTFIGHCALQMTAVVPGTYFMGAFEVKELIKSKRYFHDSSNASISVLDEVITSDLAISALGGLIVHLCRLMLDRALCNGEIMSYEVYQNCVRLDGHSLLNLEIFCNNADGSSSGTLYSYLDNCITASGKRLLRKWICHPLRSGECINERLNVVEGLIKNSELMFMISQYLQQLPDLERLLGQVKASVGSSLTPMISLLGEKILKQRVKTFVSLVKGLRVGVNLLEFALKESHTIPSILKVFNLPAGGDRLGEFLKQFEAAVDDNFPNYKDFQVKESDAETLGILINLFAEKFPQWSGAVYAVSCIDVLRSFAATANSSVGSMCKPVVLCSANASSSCKETSSPVLKIKGLWHPYASRENAGGLVPNDVYLGEDTEGCCPCTMLLTGPNMGGKSTLLRATCIAVILAQLGCYVPSEMCTLSPVDTVFTRLGASDRIMAGESTFFVECNETALILQHATQESLVLLDELGRGTSSFDGYAIAYAAFRYLVERVHCRMLFSTHYHSLTKEFASHPFVNLRHMACAFEPESENGNGLIFLYKLTPGASPESYGLQVAHMAGIPQPVVEDAARASAAMKMLIGDNFRSCEKRSDFSTLHEEWFRTLLAVSEISCHSSLDEDASDTLLCIWHELNRFHKS